MPYEYRCSENLLTRDALSETLIFLFAPQTVAEREALLRFAMAACDSWSDVEGNATLWLWLADECEWRPKRKHLRIQDLKSIGDAIEKDIEPLSSMHCGSYEPQTGSKPQDDEAIVLAKGCTDFTITRHALITTLSFLFQPKSVRERKQLSLFAEAVCELWVALDDSERSWRIYTQWLAVNMHLGKILTCEDLGSLGHKIGEHLTALHLLNVVKSTNNQ